ncbi:unnamed protein product [Bursaphelenchus xylophilus]|uniref:(pine wood nematode) hypothetical protein n=1 Tax=Bursaphelenchus xylophilus TaxID=6326 RepID=A0A7I8WHR8_BURXY|nr:unnamed protein product [Bursaphelenchus xylophilus]CAG9109394.1 unnamed protein product [Bursaphelenchus xylophilus]
MGPTVNAASLHGIPKEIQLRIFQKLSVEDVESLGQTSSYLKSFIRSNRKYLARLSRHLDVDMEKKECRIRRESTSNQVTCQCMLDDSEQHLQDIEVSTLTLSGPLRDEGDLEKLVSVLNNTRQLRIRSFHMKKMIVQNKSLCERLYQLLANGTCHAISLEECQLACGFNSTQADRMNELIQFTVKDCAPMNGLNLLNKYLSKLAMEMRFRSKKSMPFYAEAPDLTVQEVCNFIKSWINISEAPGFQIYVTQCDTLFFHDFLAEFQFKGSADGSYPMPIRHPTEEIPDLSDC